MLKIDGYSIELTRGDTMLLTINLTDDSGNPVTLSESDELWFRLKKKAKDIECLIEKRGDNESMLIRLDPEDTEKLPFGDYKYEVEVVFDDADIHTTVIAYQNFKISEELEMHGY